MYCFYKTPRSLSILIFITTSPILLFSPPLERTISALHHHHLNFLVTLVQDLEGLVLFLVYYTQTTHKSHHYQHQFFLDSRVLFGDFLMTPRWFSCSKFKFSKSFSKFFLQEIAMVSWLVILEDLCSQVLLLLFYIKTFLP